MRRPALPRTPTDPPNAQPRSSHIPIREQGPVPRLSRSLFYALIPTRTVLPARRVSRPSTRARALFPLHSPHTRVKIFGMPADTPRAAENPPDPDPTELPVRLHIVRHGKAVDAPTPTAEFPRPDGYPADWDRPLMPRGYAQARYLAQHLPLVERRIKFVLSSRYPRAIQTARIIAAALDREVITDPALEVDRPVSGALDLIQRHADQRALLIVGHNPQLAELISVLSAGLPPESLVLKTGELVSLESRANSSIGSARLVERLRLPDDAALPQGT